MIAEDTPVNQVLPRALAACCRERHFDLALIDMQMPVMDGLEATRCIRVLGDPHQQQVIIVAIMANALDEDRVRIRDASMNDCISKPFRPGNWRRCWRVICRAVAHWKRDNFRLSKHCYFVC